MEINLKLKGGIHVYNLKFLMDKATTFVVARRWNAFNVILALLLYGIVFNIKDFMNLDFIRIFMSGNHVPTRLVDTLFHSLEES